MSEELIQRDLIKNPPKIGEWDFYNIGATTIKSLKEHGIIKNIDYGDVERKKIDALLVKKMDVVAVIEYKKPSEFKTRKQKEKAIKQEIEVAKKINANIIVATDTKDSIWVNVYTGNKIKDENGIELKTNFDPNDIDLPKIIEKIINSINDTNDQIKPKKLVNPTDLAKQIWQDVWSVSGATPENCLYTFVELFIFKYLSDLGILQGIYNFNKLYESYTENNQEEILELYASTIRPKIKELFPENPTDKTTIINGTIFVSKDQKAVKGYSTVFHKVLKKFKEYGELNHIDYDFKSKLFESFLKESISKKNWGQFFTPLKVVRAIVEMAQDEIKEGIKICDPACGVGKFLLEPILKNLSQFYEIKNSKVIPKIHIYGYDKGFDKDEQKTIILAKANMLIYFSDFIKDNPGITKEFSQLFNDCFHLKTNSILGTLSEPIENEYDLILTNPPYVTSGSSNLKEEIKKNGELEKYYKINAMGVEGLFTEWIIKALKPNGKAFIIVPDGIFNRQNDKNLRQFITDKCYIDGIISLPSKTFFNTPKKTYILCLTKKADESDVQINPVFTYLTSEIGESRDIYRFDIEKDDLKEAVTLYSFFKGNKSSFSKINTDIRCKIQPFKKFKPENQWTVDKWWSKSEQVELGVIEENKTIKIEDFPAIVEDVANNILSFKEEILSLNEKKTNINIEQKKNSDLFESPPTNSGLKKIHVKTKQTKKFSIPVYSASKNENHVFGYVSENSKWRKYENVLTWNKDGSANFVFYRKSKFVPYEKVKVLKIRKEFEKFFLYDYLKIVIQESMVREGFDFNNKCSMDRVLKLKIPIPFNEGGKIDIEKQKEVIGKFEYIKELQSKVESYKKQLEDLKLDLVVHDDNIVFENINKLFTFNQGNAYYTKKRVIGNNWHGIVPVFSSNTLNEGLLMKMDLNKIKPTDLYYQYSMTWTVDGVGAGKLFVRNIENRNNEKKSQFYYTINNHCGVLIPKTNKIDLEYLKHIIQPLFYEEVKGYNNKKLGSNQIEKLEIPIPVMNNGEYDLQTQIEMSKKFNKIELIKNNIIDELDKILDANIDFE